MTKADKMMFADEEPTSQERPKRDRDAEEWRETCRSLHEAIVRMQRLAKRIAHSSHKSKK